MDIFKYEVLVYKSQTILSSSTIFLSLPQCSAMYIRVPQEVLEHVIDSTAQDPALDPTVYGTLRALSLTSHGCVPRSRFNLFHHVVLRTGFQIAKFAESIADNTHLATMVVVVTIAPRPPGFISFSLPLRKLKGIKHVNIGVDWTKYPPLYAGRTLCFASVRHLQLAGTTFRDLADFVRVVRTFPDIRTLELACVAFEKGHIEGGRPEPPWDILSRGVSRKLSRVHVTVRLEATPISHESLTQFSAESTCTGHNARPWIHCHATNTTDCSVYPA